MKKEKDQINMSLRSRLIAYGFSAGRSNSNSLALIKVFSFIHFICAILYKASPDFAAFHRTNMSQFIPLYFYSFSSGNNIGQQSS